MKPPFRLVAVLLALGLTGPMLMPAYGQDAAPEITLEADEISASDANGIAEARGQVVLGRGQQRLETDYLSLDRVAKTVSVPGPLTLTQANGQQLRAASATLDQNLDSARFDNLQIALQPHGELAANSAKQEGQIFTLDDVTLTTCKPCADGGAPLWQIRAAGSHYDREKQNVMHKHARLEVAGLPVFYLPYLAHAGPEVDRRSGFLTPSYARSRDFGSSVLTPYYVDLAPNYDITVTPQFSQKQDPLLQADWRHLLANGNYQLSLIGHQPKEALRGSDDQHDFRGGVIGDGTFQLGAWRTRFRLEDSTDDLFLRRYKFIERDTLNSNLTASRAVRHGRVSLAAYHYRATLGNETSSTVDKILPRITYAYAHPRRVAGGRFSASQNFAHVVRDKGLDVTSLDSRLDWQRTLITPAGFRWSLGNRLDINARHYHDEDTDPVVTDKAHDILAANSAYAGLGYPLGRQLGGFSERLEPQVQIIWASDNDRYGRIPLRSAPSYNLTTNTLFRVGTPADEASRVNYGLGYRINHSNSFVAALFAGQSYNLTDKQFGAASGFGEDRSAIVTNARLGYRAFAATQSLRLDEDSGETLRHNATLRITTGPFKLASAYDFYEAGQTSSLPREEASASLTLNATDNWTFEGRLVEDIENDRRVRRDLTLGYQNECVRADFTVSRNEAQYGAVAPETTVRFSFNLISFTGN